MLLGFFAFLNDVLGAGSPGSVTAADDQIVLCPSRHCSRFCIVSLSLVLMRFLPSVCIFRDISDCVPVHYVLSLSLDLPTIKQALTPARRLASVACAACPTRCRHGTISATNGALRSACAGAPKHN